MLFTDESRFLLRCSDGRVRVFHRRRERFSDNCVIRHDRYGGESVMVWAGITAHGRNDLVFIEGTLNAQKFLDVTLYHSCRPMVKRSSKITPAHTLLATIWIT